MMLARVWGTVVSSTQHRSLDGRSLLVCEELSPEAEPTGAYQIAVDSIGVGVGEMVLLLDEGNGARQVLGDSRAPVRTVVVGVVDQVALEG